MNKEVEIKKGKKERRVKERKIKAGRMKGQLG